MRMRGVTLPAVLAVAVRWPAQDRPSCRCFPVGAASPSRTGRLDDPLQAKRSPSAASQADWFDAPAAPPRTATWPPGTARKSAAREVAHALRVPPVSAHDPPRTPQHAAGIGGTYRANTKSDFQEGGWLRQGGQQEGEGTQGDWRPHRAGRPRALSGRARVGLRSSRSWNGCGRTASPSAFRSAPSTSPTSGGVRRRTRHVPENPCLLLSGYYFLPIRAGSRSAPGATWGSTSAASR